MVRQEGQYYLDHDPETVFSYMNKPENAAKVSSALSQSRSVGRAENGGWIVEAKYELGGGLAEGTIVLEPELFEENNRIRYVFNDDVSGYVDWVFEPHEGGTMFNYEAEYVLDIPIPDMLVSKVVSRISQNELETIMENLRENLEEYKA